MSTTPTLIKTIANILTTNLISLSTKYDKPVEELINKEILLEIAKLYDVDQINNQGLVKTLEYFIENPTATLNNFETEIKNLNVLQVNDSEALQEFVDTIILNYPVQVEQYKSGKVAIIGFLIGKCMEESNKTGNPAKFKELLTTSLQ
jgi:aspartyl-tRNA(Asn)/glutamyl-tRNA(Gln) amidotransferase subunit B